MKIYIYYKNYYYFYLFSYFFFSYCNKTNKILFFVVKFINEKEKERILLNKTQQKNKKSLRRVGKKLQQR